MTGHHLPRHGVTAINSAMADHHVMFPQRLRKLGYRTGLIGKLHAQAGGIESRQRHPNDGFDRYELYYGGGAMMDSPLNAYAPWCKNRRPDVFDRLVEYEKHAGPIPAEVHMNTWSAQRTEAFFDEVAGSDNGQPFFLMVSIFDPHNPYDDHPPEVESRVDPRKLPPLIEPPEARSAWPNAIRRHAADNYFADFRDLSNEQVRQMRVGYYAEVGMIDDWVGRLLAMLDARNLSDNTLVLFCSDHGDLLGDHGLMVKGGVPYQANIRVPVIARWPGRFSASHRYAGPLQLNDLTALILSAAGIDTDELKIMMPDAINPLPALQNRSGRRREVAIHAYRNSGFARGHVAYDPPVHLTIAVDGRYKLAWYHSPPDIAGPPAIIDAQCFDLDADPKELNSLNPIAIPADRRDRLKQALEHFLIDESKQLAESA